MRGAKRFSLCRAFFVLAMLAVIFSWTPHHAANAFTADTRDILVTMRVDVHCGIVAQPLDFGTYAFYQHSDAQGSIFVDCDAAGRNNAIRIRIGQGQYPAAGSTAARPRRQMSNGASGRLRYDIYQDAARTEVWGDTVGTAFFPGGMTFPATIPIYGRIPAGQSQSVAPFGTYNDTALVTLYF
jgi:spore coat protein U-like protein